MIGRRHWSARREVCFTTIRAAYAGFGTRITFALPGETQWLKQELASPRVPIVRTVQRNEDVEIVQETFALAPPLAAPQAAGGAFP